MSREAIPEDLHTSLIHTFEQTKYNLLGLLRYIQSCTHMYRYEYEVAPIRMYVYVQHDLPPALTLSKLQQVFQRCAALAHSSINIIRLPSSGTWTIHFIPYDYPRYFPKTDDSITPVCINGGFTYVDESDHSDIYIFRLEEFPKVMLHELLHHSDCAPSNWSYMQLMKLREMFGIHPQSQFHPTEAIVEFYAELFHLRMISDNELDFQRRLRTEQNWGRRQASKVFQRQKRQSQHLWMETTNVYSYIVLRTILLMHANFLLQHPLTYFSNPETFIHFMIQHGPSFKQQPVFGSLPASFRMTYYGSE